MSNLHPLIIDCGEYFRSKEATHVAQTDHIPILTLDGVMDSPEQWNSKFLSDAEVVQEILSDFSGCDLMVYGKTTYSFFASRWPSRTGTMADHLNNVAKVVMSTTLQTPEWNNSTIIQTDAGNAIQQFKQQPGKNIMVLGSHRLVQTLMQQNVIDEYELYLHPLTLGKGKRLFEHGMVEQSLKLVTARAMASGVIALTYQPNKD
jgi:dihydrofolate reductase